MIPHINIKLQLKEIINKTTGIIKQYHILFYKIICCNGFIYEHICNIVFERNSYAIVKIPSLILLHLFTF
jgi:hypothetical protein